MNQSYPSNIGENFLNYNENNFAIDFLSKHIESNKFKELSKSKRSTILKKYKEILISKTYIDEQLLHRHAQIPCNQALLKNLLKKFDTAEDREEIKKHITQNNYWEESKLKLNKTDTPIELTNTLKAQISTVNSHRLDGVWSRNLTNTVMAYKQISSPVYSVINEQVNTLNGLTSYGFYVARGGMETIKLFKHGFSNHDFYKDNNISKLAQFQVQWKLRSPAIINDILLWAPVNAITFHFWLDMKGNILTSILLLGDLIHSIYNYYVCNQRFEYLKNMFKDVDELDEFIKQMETEHQMNLAKQKYFMGYQFLLLSAFTSICGFFINWASSTQLSFALIGGLVCFSIQFFVNLIDSIFELKATEDANQIKIIYFKMVSRILLQASIPALFIGSGFLLPMLALNLPASFITLSLLAMSTLLVKLSSDLNQLFAAYMTPYDNQTAQADLIRLGQEISKEPKSEDNFGLNSKIEQWLSVYQEDFKQTHAYDTALIQIKKDLAYGLSLMSFISSSALVLSASSALAPIILLLISALSLATAMHIKMPEINEAEMSKQLQINLPA